jgi:hypothetical protein
MRSALFDLVAPDIVYSEVTSSGLGAFSKPEQLHNKILGGTKYMSMERNRCILDGTWAGLPDSAGAITGEYGVKMNAMSGADGTFATPQYIVMPVTNCDILQAAAVAFPGNTGDGVGVDFTLEIYSGASLAHTETVTGNKAVAVYFEGFTVYSVTALKVTVTKWSLPKRYARLTEIIPGIYEKWYNDTIYTLSISQEADFSCMSLPYGTAVLEIRNKNMRFDRRNKSGLFLSIKERQGIPLYIGPTLPDGTVEYIAKGVYYQQNGGWETGRRGLTMKFKLVDIIGLLASRKYNPPAVLPTTAEGWIASIVLQLGDNFAGRYIIDASIASTALTLTATDVANITCGNLLRYVCMATSSYPKADDATGYLKVAPPPESGGTTIPLGQMTEVPKQSDNEDIASITFQINDVGKTKHTVDGTIKAASKTLSISNPFIKTTTQADTVARYILRQFGGNRYEIMGRGDMRSEIGDLDIAALGLGDTAGGRRKYQEYKLNERSIMRGVKSILVQATGDKIYTNIDYITETGTYIAPAGTLHVILIQAGDGGTDGEDGSYGNSPVGPYPIHGAPGVKGLGGKIREIDISTTIGAALSAVIGDGGLAGLPGGATTLAGHSSEDGERLNGWTDILSGNVYGRDGTDGEPYQFTKKDGTPGGANTGDGGGGGGGGRGILIAQTQDAEGNITTWSIGGPFPGGDGAPGGKGAIIVMYDK